MSKPIISSIVRPSNLVSGSNVRSIKPVSVSSIFPSKQTCSSNIRPSRTFSTINVHPTKSVSASNICSGKPVCRNNVRSSKLTCRSNVCQSKPTNVNILPCKPVLTGHICQVNSSILSQRLLFIFFLSILMFSVSYKFSIITMNIFTNLLLAIVMLLSKLTRLREFFIMFISRNSTFLRFSLNIYITFQSCQTMLLLKISEVSFFTSSICVFAILNIFVRNFSTSNVETNCFKSISQKFGKIWNSFALIFLIQWNLSKADTYGREVFVCFREVRPP